MKEKSLLNPVVDFFMIGGLSLFFLFFFLITIPDKNSTHNLGWTMFYLSFFVNFPHFLISYQFLYIDNFHKIMKDWRCFTAGLIVPVVLIAYIAYTGFFLSSKEFMGYMANGLFFLVGWHYVKQIMGCVLVVSTRNGFYFSKFEKNLLLMNCLCVWMISYLGGNLYIVEHLYYGVPYKTFAFPALLLKTIYGLTIGSVVLLTGLLIKKSLKQKMAPPFNAVIAFLTLYIWHLPALYHPGYFLMIPFFHSLQYMLFALAYSKNRFAAQNLSQNKNTGRVLTPTLFERTVRFVKGEVGFYVLLSVITGALFFHFIPERLDKSLHYDEAIFGPQVFMFAFHIFLNIHHYFIDFAVWRRDNENVKQYLFS